MTTLIDKEFKGLEGWMTNKAHPKVIELTKLLAEDLSDNEARWECESQLGVIEPYIKLVQRSTKD